VSSQLSSQIGVPPPSNTKQFNTVNASMDLQQKKSISNDVDEGGSSTKRTIRGQNLKNNSMNSTSLQNHYQNNKNSKLFAQSSISNEMMRKNVMNDILRQNIDAVDLNFNNKNNPKMAT
jgi:hypothetical protein